MKRFVVSTAALAVVLAMSASALCAQPKGKVRLASGQPSVPSDGSYYLGDSVPESYGPGSGHGAYAESGYYQGGCNDGCCSDGGCDVGCCDGYGYGCEPTWWDCFSGCNILGTADSRPRWYVTADYLYVRASFSEAIAYLEQNEDLPNPYDTFHELDFQHESSYRVGGGYKLGCCDEEVRLMFTRLSSYANDVAPVGSFVAYEASSPDGPTLINANVDVKSFDLDYRKTIPLGGDCGGCECGDACCDPCGCGDVCCAPACPAWDITWSGGVRFADVNWYRDYVALDDSDGFFRAADSALSFEGGGPRVGLEGRRYFGQRNWCSAYLKGDISVLLGQMHHEANRLDEGDILTTQTAQGRRIIPVTELEAGLSAHLSQNSLLSVGYLFSAWHDLGFRDQFNFVTQLEDLYDDANILGFDGLFVKLELGY